MLSLNPPKEFAKRPEDESTRSLKSLERDDTNLFASPEQLAIAGRYI
jgi:hypothetical protein